MFRQRWIDRFEEFLELVIRTPAYKVSHETAEIVLKDLKAVGEESAFDQLHQLLIDAQKYLPKSDSVTLKV